VFAASWLKASDDQPSNNRQKNDLIKVYLLVID